MTGFKGHSTIDLMFGSEFERLIDSVPVDAGVLLELGEKVSGDRGDPSATRRSKSSDNGFFGGMKLSPAEARRLNDLFVQGQRKRVPIILDFGGIQTIWPGVMEGRITPRIDKSAYNKRYWHDDYRPRHVLVIASLGGIHSGFEDEYSASDGTVSADTQEEPVDWTTILKRVNKRANEGLPEPTIVTLEMIEALNREP